MFIDVDDCLGLICKKKQVFEDINFGMPWDNAITYLIGQCLKAYLLSYKFKIALIIHKPIN